MELCSQSVTSSAMAAGLSQVATGIYICFDLAQLNAAACLGYKVLKEQMCQLHEMINCATDKLRHEIHTVNYASLSWRRGVSSTTSAFITLNLGELFCAQ